MGEVVADVALENASDRSLFEEGYRDEAEIRHLTIKAVVDTGAAMLVLPQDLVTDLGIRTRGTVTVSYADDRREDRPVAGGLNVRIGNRGMTTDCIVGPPQTEALVGQIVLEALDLVVDCGTRTVCPRPESPDRPLLRL